MPLPDAIELIRYWDDRPPEHELLAMFARIFTTWTGAKPRSQEEVQVEHARSLEQRWAAGAMSARDLVGSMGGGAQHVLTV